MPIAHSSLPPEYRWRPSPLITMSMLAHAVAVAVVMTWHDTWPVVLGAIAGNHLLLGVAGLMPRSSLLGSQLARACPRPRRRGARSH